MDRQEIQSHTDTLILSNDIPQALKVLEECLSDAGNEDVEKGKYCLLRKIEIHIIEGKYKKALEGLEKIKVDTDSEYLHHYKELLRARCSYYSGDFLEVKDMLAARFYRANLSADRETKLVFANQCNIIAKSHHRLGEHYFAFIMLCNAYNILKSCDPVPKIEMAQLYSCIGLISLKLEDFDTEASLSREVIERGLSILEDGGYRDCYLNGLLNNDLAQCYFNLGNGNGYKEAYEILDKAEQIFNGLPASENYMVIVKQARGVLCYRQKNYASSLTHHKEELLLREQVFPQSKHPNISRNYRSISRVHLGMGQHTEALREIQKALYHTIRSFPENSHFSKTPTKKNLNDINSPLSCLKALKLKSEICESKYKAEGQIEDLELSCNSCYAAIELIQIIEKRGEDFTSKLNFKKTIREIQEQALRVFYKFYQKYKKAGKVDYKLKNRIFQIMKNTNASLMNRNRDGQVLAYPEGKVRSLSQKIFDTIVKDANEISYDRLTVLNNIYKANNLKNGVTTAAAKNVPENEWGLNDFTNELRDENVAVISYFVGTSDMYALLVSKDDFTFKRKKGAKKRKPIEEAVEKFIDLLNEKASDNYCMVFEKDKEKHEFTFFEYVKFAGKLYEELIRPFSAFEEKERIYIIPDDFLSKLPFGALISNASSEKSEFYNTKYNRYSFQRLKFLISQINIGYFVSIDKLYQFYAKRKEQNSPIAPSTDISYLGIAGIYQDENQLNGYEKEIKNFASRLEEILDPPLEKCELINRDNVLTKHEILEKLPNFDIVHFAIHSAQKLSNPQEEEERNPMLILSNLDGEKITLDRNDLGSLPELKCRLLILSGCGTSLGPLAYGEGKLDLPREFFKANALNIICTLFDVPTESSCLLMYFFSKYLIDESKSISLSLQKAKKALIETPIELLKEGLEDFDVKEGFEFTPRDWAGYIFLGNQTMNIKNEG